MENSLYQEKVGILSRLIKESSLTLEEALLLLKEEEIEKEAPVLVPQTTTPWISYPYIQPYKTYTQPYIFSSGSTTTTSITCTNSPFTTLTATADLNS